MIELSTIIAVIGACVPSIISVIGIIFSVIRIIKGNKNIVKPVEEEIRKLRENVESDDLKNKMYAIMCENRQIKKELADLITEMRKQNYEIPDNKEV